MSHHILESSSKSHNFNKVVIACGAFSKKLTDQLRENIGSIEIELNKETLDKINLIHNNNPNPAP